MNQWSIYKTAVFDAKVFYLKEGKIMFHHGCSLKESVQTLLYKTTYGIKSLVIRQKSKSHNGCLKKTKQVKFFETRTFLPPDKCSFFGKFDLLCFVDTPILRFALLRYYRQNHKECEKIRKWTQIYNQTNHLLFKFATRI